MSQRHSVMIPLQSGHNSLGIEGAAINIGPDKGFVIHEIIPDGAAAHKGTLKIGDIITAINNTNLTRFDLGQINETLLSELMISHSMFTM